MVRTALDDVTTLRDPGTKIVTPKAEAPKPSAGGPEVKQAGQGQVKAFNPLTPVPPRPEYEAAQAASKAAREAYTASQGASGGGGADALIAKAKEYVGTPYAWGKSSPLGFDCSGFTQYVFKQFGVNLPRMSNQQGFGGTSVTYGNAKPGDLIFWDNSSRNNGADHVGIYLGNGMLISAPKPGDRVKIQAVYGKPFFRRYL